MGWKLEFASIAEQHPDPLGRQVSLRQALETGYFYLFIFNPYLRTFFFHCILE